MSGKLTGETHVEVSVPGTVDGIREALDAFERFAKPLALPGQTGWRFLVALDEILANIVRHGLCGRDGHINLWFSFVSGALTLAVMDDGDEFNPLAVAAPDCTAPLEERRPGGLGIALARNLIDDVSYERRAGRNHLTLCCRVGGGPETPSARTPHAD